LKPDDRVVVVGLQQVRAGAVVAPKLVTMPVSGSGVSQGAASSAKAAP
jgi:multidrug efflux system membrane fusion protein